MPRRPAILVLAMLVVAGCSDNNLTLPLDDGGPLAPRPSFAQVDASTGGPIPGFYFLPPLVNKPEILETFDPTLRPSMEVCKLTGNPLSTAAVCTPEIAVRFPAGSAVLSDGHYAFSWDTNGPETSPLDPEGFYRLAIRLEGRELGYLDLNPQLPSGQSPGEDYPGLYAFRVGETLPVKFFLSHSALCDSGASYVIQCTASAIFDENGGVLSLESAQAGWPKLSVVLPAGALPGVDVTVRVTMERIDPDLFFAATGEQCLPSFDAPQFSDCLRVTTDPILTQPLEIEGLVEMCIDPFALGLPLGQEERLQIMRYPDGGQIQGLPARDATTCGTLPQPSPSVLGLLPVPEQDGLLRRAVVGVNTLARMLAPEPLAAFGEIRLAGAVSNFSRFRWALPGQMVVTAGDGLTLQASDSKDVTATVQVVDAAGAPVEGATVHFANGADVLSDAGGLASTVWSVPNTAGGHTFTATALGLLDVTVPSNLNLIDFVPATVTFTVTVAGPPSSSTLTGTLPEDGAVVATPWPGIGMTVRDANTVIITDATLVWSQESPGCDTGTEDACGSVVDNGDGTVTWTLGTIPGANTLIGTVAGTDPAVTSQWTVVTVADAPHHVSIDPVAGAVVGQSYAMTGTVFDQYENVRDDALAWSVAGGGGSVVGSTWTLGTVAGTENTITATVVGTDPAVAASYGVTPVADAPDKVVAVSGSGQTGPISAPLDDPLEVLVTDQYGNTTPDQSVAWTADGGSSVSATAPYVWTLGPTPNQTYTAVASVAGGSQAATFTAMALCRPTIDGRMDAGEWACAEVRGFTANISGGGADAEVYWQNDRDNLYLAVRVRQASLEKVNSLRFDFDNGNGIHDAGDDAIGYDAGAGSFYDQYLTAKCANSGQSGCGADDRTSRDGEGAMGNDGTWTVYELSHPLRGTPGEDFIRSVGENLGFFLTLRVGNGAQGNTQWPGFRVFQGTTIR